MARLGCRRATVGEGGSVLLGGRGIAGRTMSSGSSGKRVIVPEPSRSMFCLMSRILERKRAFRKVSGLWICV